MWLAAVGGHSQVFNRSGRDAAGRRQEAKATSAAVATQRLSAPTAPKTAIHRRTENPGRPRGYRLLVELVRAVSEPILIQTPIFLLEEFRAFRTLLEDF